VPFSTCKLQEALFIVSKFAVLGTMLAIGFERWKATGLVQHQMQPPESPILATAAIGIVWSISLGLAGFLVSGCSTGTFIDYCNTLFVYDPISVLVVSVVLVLLEISSVGLFGYIWIGVVRNWRRAFRMGLSYGLNDR